jgi:hypothetical protein
MPARTAAEYSNGHASGRTTGDLCGLPDACWPGHKLRFSCGCRYLGVKGSRVQIPPSRLFFERFFAMYSSSTAVPKEGP